MSFDPQNPSARRKRGAPKGNQNALKHGYYSRTLRLDAPPPAGDPQTDEQEIAALRSLIQSYSQAALQLHTAHEVFELARSLSRVIARLSPLYRRTRT